jgi:hypothetical protein
MNAARFVTHGPLGLLFWLMEPARQGPRWSTYTRTQLSHGTDTAETHIHTCGVAMVYSDYSTSTTTST